jgi:hypothetical protein
MEQTLQWTPLLLKRLALAIQPTTRFMMLEGPARSAKTMLAIQIVYYRLINTDATIGVIAGRDYDAINSHILQAETIGFFITHPECKLIKDKIGGYYISVPQGQDEKIIYLVGYDNESRWKKILGGSADIVLVDEANIANKTLIDETFARQLASNNPLTIFTTNGDNPDHYIYQDYANYGKIIGKIPSSTYNQISEFQAKKGIKEGYYYCYFSMRDNPVMTPNKIERAKTVYPIGSYYYITKILGIRGVQGELIFTDYMSQNLLYDTLDFTPAHYTIGMDIGATKAYSVISMMAWDIQYKRAYVMKIDSFKSQGYESKKAHLRAFLLGASDIEKRMIEGIFIDSAESNFIKDISSIIKREFNLECAGSYKATIKERIDMMIIGFSSKRIKFNKQLAGQGYDAYRQSKWEDGKIGEVREDLGLEMNDIMDSVEYAMTRHMAAFIKAGGLLS